jgi:GT2 family glycosyltransferase
MKKLVFIIILNWNGWEDTVECVESCRKLTYPDYRILIVDNGSTDGSEAILQERFPEIDVLQTGSNLGFAGGNNVGIRYALEQGAGYVWLLNNDTVVDTDALGELIRVAESDERTGLVGSKIYYFDQPDLLWFAGGGIRERSKFSYHVGAKQLDLAAYQIDRPVDFITGCSCLVKSATIKEVGLMREDYFLYVEDVDWNMRIKRAGWTIMWAAKSRVWHKVSSGHGQHNPFLNYYCVRNVLHCVRRNSPLHLPYTLATVFYRHVILKLVQRDFLAIKWAGVGLIDFFAGKLGKHEPGDLSQTAGMK